MSRLRFNPAQIAMLQSAMNNLQTDMLSSHSIHIPSAQPLGIANPVLEQKIHKYSVHYNRMYVLYLLVVAVHLILYSRAEFESYHVYAFFLVCLFWVQYLVMFYSLYANIITVCIFFIYTVFSYLLSCCGSYYVQGIALAFYLSFVLERNFIYRIASCFLHILSASFIGFYAIVLKAHVPPVVIFGIIFGEVAVLTFITLTTNKRHAAVEITNLGEP